MKFNEILLDMENLNYHYKFNNFQFKQINYYLINILNIKNYFQKFKLMKKTK